MKNVFTIFVILLGMAFPARSGDWPRKILQVARRMQSPQSWGVLQGARPEGVEFLRAADGARLQEFYVPIEKNRNLSDAWRTALNSSFFATPPQSAFNNVFSGVVFQSEYNGRVFGVISTHALSEPSKNLFLPWRQETSLRRDFVLQAFDTQGQAVDVPARVVQLGAFGTIDISLVEIAPVYQHLFTPVRIAKQPVPQGEELFSQGFTSGRTVFIPGRQVLQTTPFAVRTSMPGPDYLRRGLCGSPIFNTNGELVAIHTGSKMVGSIYEDDIGYGTKAQLLEKLVEAYENGGEAFIPFELAGVHITDLRVDEYVSRYTLRNEEGRAVWDNLVGTKFPFNHVQKLIDRFSPRYMDITIGRIDWAKSDGQFVEFEHEVRQVRYDFQTHQTVEIESKPLYQELRERGEF